MNTGFPTSRSYLMLALGLIAFVGYVSLLPFDLHWLPVAAALEQFRDAVSAFPSRLSRSDVLANVLLFVPIGFTLAGVLLVDRRSWLRRIAVVFPVLLLSATISTVVEYLQTYAPGRVSSSLDIAAQTGGSVIGIAVWMVAGDTVTRWLRAAAASRREGRLSYLVAGYSVAWLFVSLAPFDITLGLGDLADRLRSGDIRVVPFFGRDGSPAELAWDALAAIISAIPLGLLAVVTSVPRLAGARWAFGAGTALVVLVEVAQVFIRSHTADTTDAICGSLGVAVGSWMSGRWLPAGRRTLNDGSASPMSWPAAGTFIALCAVLTFYHWQPFDFGVDEELIRQKLAGISLLPFDGYRSGPYLNALNNLLTKLALSLPLGVCAALTYRETGPRGAVTLAWLVAAALIFATIEGGQFFLATRTPDPTDVLVGTVGVYAGLVLGRWVRGDGTRSPQSCS